MLASGCLNGGVTAGQKTDMKNHNPQEGTITIGLAILSGFVLPNYPATTPWLTDEEKHFAEWRLLADVNEEDSLHDQTIMTGLKLALKDYRLYLFVLFQHISLLSQTFQYFFPAIVGTLGYGSITTLWLTAPVWVCIYRVFEVQKTKSQRNISV